MVQGLARDAVGEESAGREGRATPVSRWEWAVAAIGLALVVGTLGFLLAQAFAGGNAPPQVELHTGAVQPVGDGFLVTFTATNRGDATAATLVVEGTLFDGDTVVETSTATLTYLPANSTNEGGLYFAADPRRHRLVLRAKGYEKP